ncbi:2'-5' RNA ligase family protein [Saccharopolyspora gregorii]|uniref:2'-5' RNA ligase family protein n=1 Tax=Saccharopolyspora gregorii TaxID=33914 RepID=A0ABP6RWY5_9PSEU|nr:2'-5' RNA ligase family protein [Saccharopolyspora gregorii]
MTELPHADQVRNHARWRPGWHSGRTSYAWLLPFADQPGLRNLVNQYQYALRDLPGFDLVPLEWMHILVQEVGFTDEVPPERTDELVAAAGERLAGFNPLALAFHRAVVLPESLSLPAEPQTSLWDLRERLRAATADVLGAEQLPAEPEEVDRHISLAFSTTEGPAIFAVATLGGTDVDPTTAKSSAVSLVRLNRDHSCSEWETIAQVPLG